MAITLPSSMAISYRHGKPRLGIPCTWVLNCLPSCDIRPLSAFLTTQRPSSRSTCFILPAPTSTSRTRPAFCVSMGLWTASTASSMMMAPGHAPHESQAAGAFRALCGVCSSLRE